MNGTKKGFMLAGGILAIIAASSFIILALILLAGRSMVDVDFVTQIINETNLNNPNQIALTEANINMVMRLTRSMMMIGSLVLIAFAVLNLVFGIKVLKLASAKSNKNASVITLLVVSILSCNMLTAAFMIVSLCLKFKEDMPVTPDIEVEAA